MRRPAGVADKEPSVRLPRLSIRSRLLLLGAVSTLSVLACVLIAYSAFASMSQHASNATRSHRIEVHAAAAFEGWLQDDDQSNMYVAVVALRDPAQRQLAETTFAQVAQGYQQAVSEMSQVQELVRSARERSLVQRIDADLASYNGFTTQMRAAAVAGQIQTAIRVMTVGNLTPSNDLPVAFQALRTLESNNTAAMQSETEHLAASEGTLLLVVGLLALLVCAGATGLLIRSILRPIHSLADGLQEIAAGDANLTHRLEVTSDELGRGAEAFNNLMGRLESVVDQISQSADELNGASESLTDAGQRLNHTAEQTAAQAVVASGAAEQVSGTITTFAAGTEQMTASINEIAQSAAMAASVAAEGVAIAEETRATVAQLGDSTEQIVEVVALITSIAEQTNLLALNATIEAARAGDAGKGFAIVANEVKELAKQTSEATDSISDRIASIQKDSVATVEAIARIGSIISRINEAQTTIASAVEEQTATTKEIASRLAGVAATSGEIAESISGVAASADSTSSVANDTLHAAVDVTQLADRLNLVVGAFRN